MNIFATNPDPLKSAADLDDKRTIKMIVESAQMLSTVIHQRKLFEYISNPTIYYNRIYKPTHPNHPCTKWVGESRANYYWLLTYLKALCDKYSQSTKNTHKTYITTFQLLNHAGKHSINLPDTGQTPFINCAVNKDLGLDFRHLPVHEAYQAYLAKKWLHTDKRKPTWKYSESEPSWLADIMILGDDYLP